MIIRYSSKPMKKISENNCLFASVVGGRGRLCASLLLLFAGVVCAAESRWDLDAFQKLVGRKVELRRALAQEQSDWERQKAELERENSLLARELERLKSELAAERQGRDKATDDFDASMKDKDALEKSMGAVRRDLDKAEDKIKTLLAQVPQPLKRAN